MISAEIDIAELMGAEVYLYLLMGGQKLIARTPGGYDKRGGAVEKFAFNMDKVHLFDKETEQAICH